MKTAFILCAGFGSRLKELTRDCPKPMLLLDDKPLLEYTIRHLARQGIRHLIINLHYMADHISGYFGDGSQWGVRIQYSHENEALGTAGGVKKAEALLRPHEPFLILYGDIVTDQDYHLLFDFHRARPDALMSIILHERAASNSVVEIDERGKVTRFIERPKTPIIDKKQNWVNSGLYCCRAAVLDLIPDSQFSDFPRDVFPGLVERGALYGLPLSGYRCAIDSPQRLEKARQDLAMGQIFSTMTVSKNSLDESRAK